ncbi:hypothetical protein [Streptomyces gelaticus]|nr:hypothetical protein [Streptomyces gelaticus]
MAAEVRTFVVSDSGEFIPIESCGISFSRDRRIQGAIEFCVDGVQIFGRNDIDTIDALWSLILTYLEHFIAGEGGVLNFPERSFMLDLKRVSGGNVVVKFVGRDEKRTALSREKAVLGALASGAVEFFSAVLNSSPKEEWSYRRDLGAAVRLHEEYPYIE